MFKIGFMHPNGGGATPISLTPPTDWANNTSVNASGTSTTGPVLIDWVGTQTTVTLRIVSTNVVANPNGSAIFRIGISNTNLIADAVFSSSYTSTDFNVVINKGKYIWFRIGPSGTSRDVTVLNASNNDVLVDTFTLKAGPAVVPLVPSGFMGISRFNTPSNTYNYLAYTVQILNIPGVTTTSIYLNWGSGGANQPKLYYYVNYPGITTTGMSSISALPNSTTLTPPDVGFTEHIPGTSNITVSNGNFVTFIIFPSVPWAAGTLLVESGAIYGAISNQVICSFSPMYKLIDA